MVSEDINAELLKAVIGIILAVMIIWGVGELFFGGLVLSSTTKWVGTVDFEKFTEALRGFCENPDKDVRVDLNIPKPLHYEYHDSYAGFGRYAITVKQLGCEEKCLCTVSAEEETTTGWVDQSVTAEDRIPEKCVTLKGISSKEYCKNANIRFDYYYNAVKIGKALPTRFGSLYEKKGETVRRGPGHEFIFPTEILAEKLNEVAVELVYNTVRNNRFVLSIQKDAGGTNPNGIRVSVVSEG